MSIRNDAAILLREHGINAYEQSNDLVIFAASGSRWTEVRRFPVKEDCAVTAQMLANIIAHKVADLVSGPHTHEIQEAILVR